MSGGGEEQQVGPLPDIPLTVHHQAQVSKPTNIKQVCSKAQRGFHSPSKKRCLETGLLQEIRIRAFNDEDLDHVTTISLIYKEIFFVFALLISLLSSNDVIDTAERRQSLSTTSGSLTPRCQ